MSEQVQIYKQWFEAWADSSEREFHFANITRCLREDFAAGIVTKAERDQLVEIYKGLMR